jgi:aldehyde dehydrogenase (NAD+)
MKMNNTHIQEIFNAQRERQYTFSNSSSAERIALLKSLKKNLTVFEPRFMKALELDLNKHEFESYATEFFLLYAELKHVISNLHDWMSPKIWPRTLSNPLSRSVSRIQPKGTSLILSPWNYPVQLTLAPLISCLAAGNTAILKPSEFTPNVSSVLSELIQTTFPKELVHVVLGDAETAQALTQLPFNHVFFTGSPAVGKHVMTAAAQNLSSCTLELGGKSPVIVDASASIEQAATRIIWGKYTNAGQTCIAPDYILVEKSVQEKLVQALIHEWKKRYLVNNEINLACSVRIVSEKHWNRLVHLKTDAIQKGAKFVYEGVSNIEQRIMGLTILENVNDDMDLFSEEIFGPLLPIFTFENNEQAVDFIRNGPKPLAMYIFSRNRKNQKFFAHNSTSGGVTFNDVFMHISDVRMPFGGINNSGIGYSHGYHGFLEFSHITSEVHASRLFSSSQLVYPPYNKKGLISKILRLFS